MKVGFALLLAVFLIGMGLGAFAEAIASHSVGSLRIELPDGRIVPLQSIVSPVEFRSLRVTGWALNNASEEITVNVYYNLVSNDKSLSLGWKRAITLKLAPKERRNFMFSVDNKTIASFLEDMNGSEAVINVLVSVAPSGEEPQVYVTAGSFAAIDAVKKSIERVKEEQAEADNEVIQEVAKELGTTTEQVKEMLKQSNGRAIRKYAEIKEKKRKTRISGAPRYNYDIDKYVKMWCGSDSSCIQEVKEALSSNTPTVIPVKGYSLCGEIKVGDPGLGTKPSDMYPSVICSKPGKKVLVKRALARRMHQSYKSGTIDKGVNVGGAEREIARRYGYRLASIMLQSFGFGVSADIDVPSLLLGMVLSLVGFALIGRLRW